MRLPAILLAGVLALQAFALLRAPATWLPQQIALRLAPGESLPAGRAELAAVQTEGAQLLFRRDAAGTWMLRHDGNGRAPLLHYADHDEKLGSAALAGVSSIQVAGQAFGTSSSARTVSLRENGRNWTYDGALLYLNGKALDNCPDAPLHTRAAALWNRVAPAALALARPLVFGGNLYCGNRLGMANVAAGTASIARVKGELRLIAGAASERLPVMAGQARLREDERRLDGVQAISFGLTRYALSIEGGELRLRPQRRVALFNAPDARLPQQVDWQWERRALWTGGQPALWAGLGCAAACLWMLFLASGRNDMTARPRRQGNILSPPRKGAVVKLAMLASARWNGGSGYVHDLDDARRARSRANAWLAALRRPAALTAAASLAACGIASLWLLRSGQPPAAAASLLLGACAFALWLLAVPRMPLACSAALLLLGIGMLMQLELGLAGGDTGWLRYYQKTASLFALGSAAVIAWRLRPRRQRSMLPQRAVEWLFALLAAAALLALAAQVLWGDETGVFDMQPVELAKLALTALSAHCLALRLGWRSDARHAPGHALRWLRLAAPALLFATLLGFALVQVDDYSPLLLLLMWSGAMLLAYALAARRWLLAALPLACVLAAAGAVAMLRDAGPDGAASLPASFYADRFQVWLDPARHPHTGQQLLQGAAAVAQGGWRGADGLFGLSSLGQPAPGALAVPAVQDDFAPSFLLNRHGLAAGLLLWCVQAAFLAGLLLAAVRAGAQAAQLRDFRQAWHWRLRCFAMAGGAAFVAGHFLLSWGTNLAIFPIMGQPMSFLSAGGSHLLFFLLPLLGICAASAPIQEE
ncbi:FtsW/RodA/SpoVE family cell cycle protein [Massilia endophytica]|uniref:FtsW/RodA/SpoVE family cell cycle protein n=1 Tax=Massilia endophytica TaxID=2899220 RepID=UPI001E43C86C|nr:FtsW/RodA/SpoVE family cell cycle protein [Massilia endophytica]UGQ48318.1 FtsW/RodA/SpoVE family cell cycle protein [Massilia endophytica]